MNRKQLTLILGLVVVIGGLGLWLRKSETASYRASEGRMGEKVLGEFDVNQVAVVTLKQGTNELNLAQEGERWVVRERGGYPANFSEVSELVRKLGDLKVVQPVKGPLGASALERLELKQPGAGEKTATAVDLKDKDGKALATLLLGKKHLRQGATPSPMGGDEGWPVGRYVMVADRPESVSLVSETFSNAEPKPEQWLNKDFFKVEKPQSIAVTYPAAATNSFKLQRDTESGEWKLADLAAEEKLDPSKVSGFSSALSWPSFNDVLADAKAEAVGLDKPTLVEIKTFDGFTYRVSVGNKSGEDAYHLALSVTGDFPKERTPGPDEKPEDKEKLDKEFKEKTEKLQEKLKNEQALGKWTYLVSKWSLDSVLKERHALLVEPKIEEPPAGLSDNAPAAPALPDLTAPPLPPPAP
jgi:hypothetical protein